MPDNGPMLIDGIEFRQCLNREGVPYDGYYVSSSGIVASTKSGTPRILHKKARRGNGYTALWLGTANGPRWEQKHVLTARSWHGLPSIARAQVNHKDAVKTNDNINNLEWTSAQGNSAHATVNRLYASGECHYAVTLPDSDIRVMRTMYKHGWEASRLALLFGSNVRAVWNIVTGSSRKYAGGPITKKRPVRLFRSTRFGPQRHKLLVAIAAAVSEED